MVRHVQAVFTQGAFRPLEPLPLPDGTRVRLSIEQEAANPAVNPVPRIATPKLAHPEDAVDFVMVVGKADDAGV